MAGASARSALPGDRRGGPDVPSLRDRITFTVNDRVRGEFVDWFTPHEGAQPGFKALTSSPTGSAGVRVLLPPAELNLSSRIPSWETSRKTRAPGADRQPGPGRDPLANGTRRARCS
jgi:hypothetical protein